MPSTRLIARDTLAGIAQTERAELNRRVRSQAQRAAIFKLDFRAAAILRPDLGALRNRKVEERILKSQARVLVDLDRALYVTQANDACLRTGQGGQRQERAGSGCQKNHAWIGKERGWTLRTPKSSTAIRARFRQWQL